MAKASAVRIEVTGVKELSRALKAVGDSDIPFLRQALLSSADYVAGQTRARGVGSIGSAVSVVGLRGSGVTGIRVPIAVKHPGAASAEFGRTLYYRGYTGRNPKTGSRYKVANGRGQKAKPYIGVVNQDAAIGASAPYVRRKLTDAIAAEWGRF